MKQNTKSGGGARSNGRLNGPNHTRVQIKRLQAQTRALKAAVAVKARPEKKHVAQQFTLPGITLRGRGQPKKGNGQYQVWMGDAAWGIWKSLAEGAGIKPGQLLEMAALKFSGWEPRALAEFLLA